MNPTSTAVDYFRENRKCGINLLFLTGGEGGRGGRGLLGLKRIERFERTVLAASSCKAVSHYKISYSTIFSSVLNPNLTVELCYWHPVVPVFSAVEAKV